VFRFWDVYVLNIERKKNACRIDIHVDTPETAKVIDNDEKSEKKQKKSTS
jgi:hypothetical protein